MSYTEENLLLFAQVKQTFNFGESSLANVLMPLHSEYAFIFFYLLRLLPFSTPYQKNLEAP